MVVHVYGQNIVREHMTGLAMRINKMSIMISMICKKGTFFWKIGFRSEIKGSG